MPSQESFRTELKDILLREGVLGSDTLNEILKEQEKSHKPLLEVLIRSEKYDSQKLLRALVNYYGYPSVNPGVFVIEKTLLDLIPKKLAEKHMILPISRFENTLTVAFADPTHLDALSDLPAVTGLRVKVALADAKALKKYIERYYSESVQATLIDFKEAGGEKNIDELVKMIEVERAEESEKDSGSLMQEALETPVIKLVNMLMIEGIRRHASDIFIEPWEHFVRVRARVDGLLEEIVRPQKSLGSAIVSRIKILSELNIAEHRIPQDGRFKVKIKDREVDMRVSVLPTSFGEKVCLRILDTKAQSHDISKLGFTEKEQVIIKDSSRRPHGMILVTGPTGSGKTTTLYSVLRYLNSPEVNITTVEDPVEYQLPGVNQVNVKEHIGLTFPAALRSILRQDPDIILIGEIRDAPTLDIAVKAALTGHLVLSTLHTNDAVSAITRMINMELEPFLIASTVIMISCQRLIRRLCPNCRRPEDIEPRALERLGINPNTNPVFYKAKGCSQCRQMGYKGRTVISEILPMTSEIKELIMQKETTGKIKIHAQKLGMTTLRECALHKALAGETSLEEVFRVTTDEAYSHKDEKENQKPENSKDL